MAHEITVIHIASKHTYGAPRIHAELRRLGRRISRKRVERVMREHGGTGHTRRKRRGLTRQAKKAVPAADLLGRDFTASTPGTRLVGDICRRTDFLPSCVRTNVPSSDRGWQHGGGSRLRSMPRPGTLAR
ncbi:IS3 family transposase [Streptomyces sp. NPDC007355]|uniref:IS3 family transposase n=1 Tax=Streptomyces sp. NPDC007355 TaxID=3364778 RepID=UPI0036BC4BAB